MATVTETNTGMELHELPSPQPSPPSPPSSLKAKSKSRKSRILSAGFSFFVAGINDGSIGALLPYMLRQYEISNAIVSAMYALHHPSLSFFTIILCGSLANTRGAATPLTSSAGW